MTCDAQQHHAVQEPMVPPSYLADTGRHHEAGGEHGASDHAERIWVDWDSTDDPESPLNWSRTRKWLISSVGIIFAGMVSVNISAYSFSIPSIERELSASAELAASGITWFTLLFGIAPLLLSPLSELFGRNPIYIMSTFSAAIWLIPCALATNIQTLLVARVFLGIAGSTGINLVGGTLADVWHERDRSLPMSLLVFSAFAFTGAGPAMFSFAEARYGFRLISWCWFAASAVFFIFVLAIARETRALVLLSRKAARLRAVTGSSQWQTRHDAQRDTFGQMLGLALLRPIKILVTEPVVIGFTLWVAFAWGTSYLLLQSLVVVFQGVYGFSVGVTGFVYATQMAAAAIGLALDVCVFSRMVTRQISKRGPEAHLYCAMCGGICFPVGCWMYAFTANVNVHWIVPTIALVILYTGIFFIYLSVLSYLTAAYTLYAASALAAMNIVRNAVASAFPLFTTQMYAQMGIKNAGILTASLATTLSVVPFVLFKTGASLRTKSPFARHLAELEANQRGTHTT